MLTRIAAATVAGGIAFFILGFVIYGLILDPMAMKPNMITYSGLMNDPPIWVPLILANFVSAFFLAYIFDKWAGIRTFAGGASGGAILLFLIALNTQLMFTAFMNLSTNYIPAVADIIGSIIMGAIGGGIVGAVLGMINKDSSSSD